jgi:uncharacterized membrane protein YcaP (DUF421 family)
MFFDGWEGIGRTLLVGTLAYLALVLVLRVSGKRTLSKLNAFDLIVTVALGSTLATILLSEDVALAEGVTAFSLLVLLQWVITWLSVRSTRIASLVKSEPRLLLWQGRFIDAALKAERVTRDELRAAVRSQGQARLETLQAVVLETDGSLSVIAGGQGDDQGGAAGAALEGVLGCDARDGHEGLGRREGSERRESRENREGHQGRDHDDRVDRGASGARA